MDKEKRVCLGVIVGVHGIKGEVKVKSFTEYAEDIDSYGPLEDKSGSRKFTVKVTGHSKELLRVKVKGTDDRNQAEELIGTELYVDRDVLPELESEDEFYQADLIGLDVKLTDGSSVAEVAGIYNFGAGELLEIRLKSTGRLEMIPFTKAYVPEVNLEEGFIIVESVFLKFAPEDEAENEG